MSLALAATADHAARRLAVVLHDVSPATWSACRRVLAQVEAIAQRSGTTLPVTLLVVPRMHGRDDAPPLYLHWLRGLAAKGHELALHGLTHLDEGTPDGIVDHLRRRVYTAGEGEFAALPRAEARQRLAAASRWAQDHALPMRGFVPPAWLASREARDAIAEAGFAYTCTLSRIVALPGSEPLRSQGLTFSTRSAWRRALSVAWNHALAAALRRAPLLRLELHPHDADHAGVRRCWTRLLAQALEEREPLRLVDAAELARGAKAARGRPGTAVVAGAAGFIGSHLCERLLADGWRVVGLDDLSTGSIEHVAALQAEPRFSFVRHDISQPLPPQVTGLDRIDRIVNLACPASPAWYQQHPVATLLASTQGTWRLLELAVARQARLLQASTSEVYGDPEVHPQPESYRGHVNPIGPRSCYDEGKRCAEALCYAYARERGADVRVARLFNSYGPRLRAGDGRVVSNFVVQALSGRPLTVYGDGSQTRSFCYVDDTVRGLLALLESGVSEPVNLGNPGEYTVLQLAEEVLRQTGSRSTIVYEELPTDDPTRRQPDIALAQRELGWTPGIELADGLQRTIAWFRAMAATHEVAR